MRTLCYHSHRSFYFQMLFISTRIVAGFFFRCFVLISGDMLFVIALFRCFASVHNMCSSNLVCLCVIFYFSACRSLEFFFVAHGENSFRRADGRISSNMNTTKKNRRKKNQQASKNRKTQQFKMKPRWISCICIPSFHIFEREQQISAHLVILWFRPKVEREREREKDIALWWYMCGRNNSVLDHLRFSIALVIHCFSLSLSLSRCATHLLFGQLKETQTKKEKNRELIETGIDHGLNGRQTFYHLNTVMMSNCLSRGQFRRLYHTYTPLHSKVQLHWISKPVDKVAAVSSRTHRAPRTIPNQTKPKPHHIRLHLCA